MSDPQDRLLEDDETTEEFHEPLSEKRPRRNCIAIYTYIALALLVLAMGVGVIVSIVTGRFAKQKYPAYYCGKGPAEAKALGCKFDIMEFGWVHPECWDQELLDEYAPPDRWIFGLDRDLQSPVTQAQASSGHIDALWVKNDYHGAHCVYVFHKMAKAVAQGRPVNQRVRQDVHTHHCSMSVHGIWPANFNNTGLGGVNFMTCGWDYLK